MKIRYDKSTEEIVVTTATRIEYHQLSLWLTRHVKGYRYMPAFKMGVWNGQQSYFKNGRINLGLWKEAMKGCKEIEAIYYGAMYGGSTTSILLDIPGEAKPQWSPALTGIKWHKEGGEEPP